MLAARLSQTGCFDPADLTRPAAGVIPYELNMPFWSDGATKQRWLALPRGGTARIGADGDLELPPGTVLIKSFVVGGRRLETRFFVRRTGGAWHGYTYEWNQAGTEAVLLDEQSHTQPTAGGGNWYYPSRAECKQCHTDAAGGSLGLELAQLNRQVVYPGDARPAQQLETWSRIGLFEGPLPAPAERLPAFPAPDDARASLEARARAYLHANCAGCHRPEVDMSGTVDLRHGTALAATMSCDARPTKGSMGFGADVRIIAPGKPDRSMIVLRMGLMGAGRMPEVGSLVLDDAGIRLVSDWIGSLTSCP
jgi:uncharacterized repeat protein (TIGR03806 family)